MKLQRIGVLCKLIINRLSVLKVDQQQRCSIVMSAAAKYCTEEFGSLFTSDYRIYFKDANTNAYISAWHDIPLLASQNAGQNVYNMIVEIPRWSNAKMELATHEPMSPINQDAEKDGRPRFIHNLFPYCGYPWNYGALPQTWENPAHVDPATGVAGDNDPIDVCEIGRRVHKRGAVVPVKVLGVLAMIDGGETDWKLLTIDVSDPLAAQLNSPEDIEKHLPGLIDATRNWFRCYKIPSGKGPNRFGFEERVQSREFAERTIDETHHFWQHLISNKDSAGKLNIEMSAKWDGAAKPAVKQDWDNIVAKQPPLGLPHQMPDSLQQWHFIKQ